jgi:hypothetical protein
MYEINLQIVDQEFARVKKWYKESKTLSRPPDTFIESFKHTGYRLYYLNELTDLSEDFVRYILRSYVKGNEELKRVCKYQENLSEQFYEDFLDMFNTECKCELIKHKRVSSEFLEKHLEDFDQEVWSKIYG